MLHSPSLAAPVSVISISSTSITSYTTRAVSLLTVNVRHRDGEADEICSTGRLQCISSVAEGWVRQCLPISFITSASFRRLIATDLGTTCSPSSPLVSPCFEPDPSTLPAELLSIHFRHRAAISASRQRFLCGLDAAVTLSGLVNS